MDRHLPHDTVRNARFFIGVVNAAKMEILSAGQHPATRNPVSSKCATSAASRASTIALTAGLRNVAIFFAAMAITAGDGAQPNISASAWHARPLDRNCPCHRYTPIAAARGPYCTGAVTPSGASALVLSPQHRHATSTSWCSVTSALTGGISVTCRRSIPVSCAPSRLAPHPEHDRGRCRIT